MRKPPCAAAVDVLINGQALFTQAQRSAHARFAIGPLLVLLLLTPTITYLRAVAELSCRCSQVPTLLPFPVRVHKFMLRQAVFTELYFVIEDPNSTWRRTNHFNKRVLYQDTTVCRSTQITQKTSVKRLVFRDDWNPSHFESCPLLKPAFRRHVLVFDIQATVIPVPHKSGRSYQYWSIQSCSRSTLGGVPAPFA